MNSLIRAVFKTCGNSSWSPPTTRRWLKGWWSLRRSREALKRLSSSPKLRTTCLQLRGFKSWTTRCHRTRCWELCSRNSGCWTSWQRGWLIRREFSWTWYSQALKIYCLWESLCPALRECWSCTTSSRPDPTLGEARTRKSSRISSEDSALTTVTSASFRISSSRCIEKTLRVLRKWWTCCRSMRRMGMRLLPLDSYACRRSPSKLCRN